MTVWINLEDIMLQWNKPDTEGEILCDVIYMSNIKWSESKKQREEWWLPWAMGGYMRMNCRLKKHSEPKSWQLCTDSTDCASLAASGHHPTSGECHPDFSETLWREGNVNKTAHLHSVYVHPNKCTGHIPCQLHAISVWFTHNPKAQADSENTAGLVLNPQRKVHITIESQEIFGFPVLS